jgi:hypothetical protein
MKSNGESWIKGIIFLVLFTPIHLCTTIAMVQRFFFNPSRNACVIETVFKYITFAFSLPVLYPCMRIDPDGERLPTWLQYSSIFLNSLIWGLLVLLVFNIVKRLGTRHAKPDPAADSEQA